MPDIIAVFPTVVFQIMGDCIVMRVASEVGTGLKEVLRGRLGQTVVPSGEYTKTQTDTSVSITWKDGNLRIAHSALDNNVHRYDFFWTATRPNKLVDMLEMTGSHWYGGAQVRKMVWPVEKMKFKTAPFVAGDSYKDGEWGGVQERYWLSSKGIGVFVKPDVPLFVGINESDDNKLRLVAKYDAPYRNNSNSHLHLRYSIYHGPDIMTTHKTVSKEQIPRPIGIPDVTMFRLPLWSTWAICKEDIDQEKVLLLANQIKSYGINTSQLQIDDHWTSHRGDWEFNRDKFPNPREMVRQLADLAFRVTVWVHPFANMKSNAIKRTDLFVKGSTRGAVKWWTGIGKILDITKPTTVEWYKKELSLLQENYALTSFKFDGGEATWLPKKWTMHKECNNPNMYTKKYAELAYEMDKKWKSVEVRVGVRTQKLPIFVRMMDKDSVWSEKNGLKTIIPHALLYGIIGFPFFIPDMIGGNAYDMDRPTKSLFIRWVQVSTFMPSIQFSLPPWWFDNQTVRITKKMLALRAKYTDLLINLAKEATETGNPIIRPLWWVAPEDDFALKCDDQFLVGNDLMVAPVLTKGAKTRPLYMPAGKWKDQKTGHILDGSKWYFEYKVTIEDLPHFTRQKKEVPTPLVEFVDDTTIPLVPVTVPQSPTEHDVPPPTETEVAPDVPEVTPAVPEIIPAVPEVTSDVHEVTPAVPAIIPTVPQVTPDVAEITPEIPEVTPAVAEVTPAVAEVAPAIVEVAPAEAKVISLVTEVAPTVDEVTHVTSQDLNVEVTTEDHAVVDAAMDQPLVRLESEKDMSTDSESEQEPLQVQPRVEKPDETPSVSVVVPMVASVSVDSNEPKSPITPDIITTHIQTFAEPAIVTLTSVPPVMEVVDAIKMLSGSVDDLLMEDHYDSPDEYEELPPPPVESMVETITATKGDSTENVETGLGALLRNKLEADVDEMGSDDDLINIIRGKYRFSNLDDDIDDEFLAELADISSSAGSVGTPDETFPDVEDDIMSDDDNEFLVRDSVIEREMQYMQHQESTDVREEDTSDESSHVKAPLATQETLTEEGYVEGPIEPFEGVQGTGEKPTKDSDDEAEKEVLTTSKESDTVKQSHLPTNEPSSDAAAALLESLSGNLNRMVPSAPKRENKILEALADAVDSDLDAVIPPPPPPTRSTSLPKPSTPQPISSGLYENVVQLRSPTEKFEEVPSITEPQMSDDSPPPVPRRISTQPNRLPKPAGPRKSTLWDELTSKVHAMPKFDPEFSFPGKTGHSVSVQASFDETDQTSRASGIHFATQTSVEKETKK